MKQLFSATALVLALAGCARIEIRTAETIDAPREAVWAVLTDFDAYGEWNPYHVRVDGRPVQGSALSVQIQRPDGQQVSIDPHVMRVEPTRELTWGGGIRGIFHGEHVMRLEDAPDGGTRLIHNEDFTGLFVGFADLPPDVLTEGYRRMNRALKGRVEAAQR